MKDTTQYDIYNIIGKNIKKYRKKAGLTQKKLAESLLLSESFIAKLESVTYQTISIDTLDQIAHKLNTHISKFFLDDEEE
ncbi:MAG TPA: helix-turn-helix transcriptional regulator [Candidatus Fimihabitans intestinipullorum]|uniref:Helix-turn-helix transcriptional regulator n=1 Tax=Candidatus Fimihabitans intestinipullorum TaxID=2840820 RepID=A0A9D1HUP2_9BACT|nr:helix-turn-helix transcriptional regulator [Candidatus Fimihabitans intestinipullorum]